MKTKYLTIALAFLSLFSCKEDMLDINQNGVVSASQFYKTDEDAEQALASIYYLVQTGDYHRKLIINVMADDTHTGAGARGAQGDVDAIREYTADADNAKIKTIFQQFYSEIYRCNVLISRYAEPSTATQKRCVAEAKALRAYFYLRLVCTFGDTPLITEEITNGEYQHPCASRADIYAQIEQDLLDAINSGAMLEKSNVNDQIVNVTKQFAQAMLGKAYVYESTYLGTDKWAQAREVLEAVINSGKYALYTGNYIDMFHETGRFCCESMFETNNLRDPQNLPTYTRHAFYSWRADHLSGVAAANNAGTADVFVGGWGVNMPTKEIYDAFVAEEGVNGYRLNQVLVTYDQLVDMGITVLNYVMGCEGYFSNKTLTRQSEWVSGYKFAKDDLLFRYAEVLLLAAEAQLPEHGGSQSKVDDYINQIRQRAGVINQPGNYTYADVKNERNLELFGEETRFFDLVRWGDAKTALANKGKTYPTFYGYNEDGSYKITYTPTNGNGYTDKWQTLPIPQEELDVNPLAEQHSMWQ